MKLHGLKKKLALSTAAVMFAVGAIVAGGVAVPDAGATEPDQRTPDAAENDDPNPKDEISIGDPGARPIIRAYIQDPELAAEQ